MFYNGIHHVSLVIEKLNPAENFYSEILGLENIDRPNFDTEGLWYQIGNTQLHLIVYPGGKTFRGTLDLDRDDGHFAIQVKDVGIFIERMKRYGVKMYVIPDTNAVGKRVYVADPDGNLIEFKP